MRVLPALIVALVATALVALPGIAMAQANYEAERARIEAEQRDLQAQQQQQAEMARQQSLAAQRETDAAIGRLRTEGALQTLDSQRRYPTVAYPPPPTARSRAALNAQMQSDAARLDALTDRLLAESNARIRAIKPASR